MKNFASQPIKFFKWTKVIFRWNPIVPIRKLTHLHLNCISFSLTIILCVGSKKIKQSNFWLIWKKKLSFFSKNPFLGWSHRIKKIMQQILFWKFQACLTADFIGVVVDWDHFYLTKWDCKILNADIKNGLRFLILIFCQNSVCW